MTELTQTAAQLRASFFAAVQARELDRCTAILGELSGLAGEQPDLAPWLRYFEGILANERDHDWAAAERIFLAGLEEAGGGDLELQGRLCLALALTYRRQGRLPECIAMCERSLPIYAVLGDTVGQAKALKQMVIAYVAGFDQSTFGADVLPLALLHCRRALALLEDKPPTAEISWLQGTLWNEVGALHRAANEWDGAIDAYKRYLQISLENGHTLDEGMASGNLGEVYLQLGPAYHRQALMAFERALAISRAFADPLQEMEALANLAHLYRQNGDNGAALDRYGEAAALIGSLRTRMSSDEARTGFVATVTETLANAVLAAVAAGRPEAAFDLAEQARARSLLDMVAAEPAGADKWAAAEALTLDEVRQALAAGDVLFSYFTTGLLQTPDRRTPSPGRPQRHRFPPPCTLLFVVTRDGVKVFDTGIDPNDLAPLRPKGVVERHFLSPRLLRTLHDRLIGPTGTVLVASTRLFLAPHGPLHYVPFLALTGAGGSPVLSDAGPDIIFGPSASIMLRPRPDLLTTASAPPGAVTPCLAVGFNGGGAHPLRFAEEEAHAIAALLGGDALVGSQASREALFRQAPSAAIVHLSCHGEFNPQDPMASRLLLGSGETLTAHEALQELRLRCRLVTLSACETGLSRVQRGDELFGLVRAFMAAGAPAVVASLWRVDERSTRILMERFYEEIAGGCGFASALKRAQIYLRELTRDGAANLLTGSTSGDGYPLPASQDNAGRMGSRQTNPGLESGEGADLSKGERPFDAPFFWAAFVLVGAG